MDYFTNGDTKFALLLGCNIMIGTPYTMPVAFLPPLAKERGLDEADIGFLLSSYAVGVFFTSMIAGQYMQNWNKRQVLIYSTFLLIFGLVLFSIEIFIKNAFLFEIVGLIARLIQGISVALIACLIFSVIPKLYPDTMQKKLALMEVASGIGIGAGPIIGSIFYNIAGFSSVFLSMAVIMFVFMFSLMNQDIFTTVADNENQADTDDNLEKNVVSSLSYYTLFKSLRMILTYTMVTLVASSFSVISPVYSLFLKEKYNIDPSGASLLLSLCMIFYAIPSFFTDHIIRKKYDRRIYIMLGVLAQTTGLIMIAGSFFFGQYLIFLVIGLCLLGFGTYLGNIPALPEFIDVCKEVHPEEKIDIISDFSSGLYNGLWGLAEFIGPVLGGNLTKEYSLEQAVEIYSFIVGVIFVAYFTVGRGYEGAYISYNSWKCEADNENTKGLIKNEVELS
jgi:predicted MFS family arabinose efflux permease